MSAWVGRGALEEASVFALLCFRCLYEGTESAIDGGRIVVMLHLLELSARGPLS